MITINYAYQGYKGYDKKSCRKPFDFLHDDYCRVLVLDMEENTQKHRDKHTWTFLMNYGDSRLKISLDKEPTIV